LITAFLEKKYFNPSNNLLMPFSSEKKKKIKYSTSKKRKSQAKAQGQKKPRSPIVCSTIYQT